MIWTLTARKITVVFYWWLIVVLNNESTFFVIEKQNGINPSLLLNSFIPPL